MSRGGLLAVPVENELQNDDAVEEQSENELKLVEEVVRLEQYRAQAGHRSQERAREGEEGQLARRLVPVVSHYLRHT